MNEKIRELEKELGKIISKFQQDNNVEADDVRLVQLKTYGIPGIELAAVSVLIRSV